MEDLNIAIEGLNLDTVLVADGRHEAVTLLDLIVAAGVDRLAKDEQYKAVSVELARRVGTIRDEEIRAQITPIVTQALAGEIRQTNQWGEPTGKGSTTLRELILARVNDWFTKDINDSYGSKGRVTAAGRVVAEVVDKALKAELAAVLADEKTKVVRAVQAKAAELIATAVKEGLGR